MAPYVMARNELNNRLGLKQPVPCFALERPSFTRASDFLGRTISAVRPSSGKPQIAEIIGEQTFGKLIDQRLGAGLKGTVLKATTFRYFSPREE